MQTSLPIPSRPYAGGAAAARRRCGGAAGAWDHKLLRRMESVRRQRAAAEAAKRAAVSILRSEPSQSQLILHVLVLSLFNVTELAQREKFKDHYQ